MISFFKKSFVNLVSLLGQVPHPKPQSHALLLSYEQLALFSGAVAFKEALNP